MVRVLAVGWLSGLEVLPWSGPCTGPDGRWQGRCGTGMRATAVKLTGCCRVWQGSGSVQLYGSTWLNQRTRVSYGKGPLLPQTSHPPLCN